MFLQIGKRSFVNLDNITSIYTETAFPYEDKLRIVFESCGDTVSTEPMDASELWESLLKLKIILIDVYGVEDGWLFKSTAENAGTQSKK